jgi:16S rRNA (uracil1498-N3)-methyltransferase
MADRFFVTTPIEGDTAELTDAEARHATRVMRLMVGDALLLFDGSGHEFEGRILEITRERVRVEITDRRLVDRESSPELTLGVALPKGDRQRWLVEKATELGVGRLVPLQTRRGVAQASSGTLTKLRRVVVEACKQCGRNRLLQIERPISLPDFLNAPFDGLRWLADPAGKSPTCVPASTASVRVIIGPEGGLAPDELEAADGAGWLKVSLGPRILRVETAALVIAARILKSNRQD